MLPHGAGRYFPTSAIARQIPTVGDPHTCPFQAALRDPTEE
ncbi:hypothetical protein C791_4876 [Amycolatopsis azurea DSM 43854]|uniref:Uncharacterized protein n=1 Tax=Amycolatopsis azurea DSM 43854 TaxID=1238180 RepID=M2QF41_9PSEU|nr:hypothetical protein C791_4876 [Amycolatopsis azurea DSM 43854]